MQAKSIQQNARNLDMENMDKTGIEKQTNKQKTVAISQEAKLNQNCTSDGITNDTICISKMKLASNVRNAFEQCQGHPNLWCHKSVKKTNFSKLNL